MKNIHIITNTCALKTKHVHTHTKASFYWHTHINIHTSIYTYMFVQTHSHAYINRKANKLTYTYMSASRRQFIHAPINSAHTCIYTHVATLGCNYGKLPATHNCIPK